jgi:hypothetical protein
MHGADKGKVALDMDSRPTRYVLERDGFWWVPLLLFLNPDNWSLYASAVMLL